MSRTHIMETLNNKKRKNLKYEDNTSSEEEEYSLESSYDSEIAALHEEHN